MKVALISYDELDILSFAHLDLSLHHGFDTIVHVLDKVLLTASKSALVGDIKDAIAGIRVLSMATTDLNIELISNTLKSSPVGHQHGKVDMHGGAESSTEVGWA